MEIGVQPKRCVAMVRIAAGIVSSLLVSTVFVSLLISVPGEVSSAPADALLDIGYAQPVDSLNPYIGLTDPSYFFYGMVYDSLQSVGEDLDPVPNLAVDWWMVPESDPAMIASGEPYGSVWEYNLTHNANWTDGEPFTADDVVYTMNLNSGEYDSMWAYQPYAYFIDFAEAVDDYTVRIHFADRSSGDPIPCAYGDSILIPILPEHILSSMGAYEIAFTWNGTVYGSDPPIVGTGPFMPSSSVYDDFASGQPITLLRNPYYHGLADYGTAVSIPGVVIHYFDNTTEMRSALESGAIDIVQMPTWDYTDLKAAVLSGDMEDIECYDGPRTNQYWTYVMFNMNDDGGNPIRLDKDVRVAMSLATNRTLIAEECYDGEAVDGSTLVAPISEWHYQPTFSELYRYDLDNASDLLEISGYEYTPSSPYVRVATADSWAVTEGLVTEGTPLSFEMLVRIEYPEEILAALVLQLTWAEVGIELTVDLVSEATLSAMVYSYYYDLAMWYWVADPDPEYILFCQSTAAWNAWSDNMYSNASYEAAFMSSVQALDPTEREEYVDECQLTHYWDVPYIVLAYPDQTFAWRTDTFTGWGDWSLPGRSLDNYWGANPVLFDLEPVPAVPDTTPPTTECEVTGTEGLEGWYTSDLVVELSAMDLDGTVAFTNYSVDGGAWMTYSGPVDVGGDGTHTIEYYSADDSGNTETPHEVEVMIDTVAPGAVECDVEGTRAAGEVWYTSDVTVTLTAPEDETSGASVVMYRLDSGVWVEYVGAFPVDNDGEHNISFYCIDKAGNSGESSYADVWIDTADPTVVITSPTAASTSDSSTVVVEFTASDATSGIEAISVIVDGYEVVPVDSSSDSCTLEDLSDGVHVINVTVRDGAGNRASMDVIITVDAESDSTVLYIAGGVIVLAVVGLVALLLMRRKGMFKK